MRITRGANWFANQIAPLILIVRSVQKNNDDFVDFIYLNENSSVLYTIRFVMFDFNNEEIQLK